MVTLITGGAGFIGGRLALRLANAGHPLVLLDNFDPYYDLSLKRDTAAAVLAASSDAVLVEGDIRDEALVEDVFARYPIRRVVHLAAMSSVRYSVDRGALYSDINVTATVKLLDAARRHGVEQFVLASTSSIYGNTARLPFNEDDPATTPLAPYPASKRAAEIFAGTYHHLFGLNITILRFFNVYGPSGRPDMMPMRVIRSILHGECIPLYDGGALKRDWTYVDDVVDGLVAALERPLGFQILNLGYGSPVTLLDFIAIYERLIGRPAVTTLVDAPASEPKVTYCDNARARRLLGFNPQVALADGLARTWAWYRARYLDS